jgi:hypothetical protein
MAIGMNRIREHCGWLTPDAACAEADGRYPKPDAKDMEAAAWSHEARESDAGEGGDESRSVTEQGNPGGGQGFAQLLQGRAGMS